MVLEKSKIRIFLQMVYLAVKACAIFVNIDEVAEKNAKLSGKVFMNFTNIGFIMCARRCEAFPVCLGLNFYRTDLYCELLSKHSTIVEVTDWWYAGNVKWLKNMSLSIGMEKMTCKANENKIKMSRGAADCTKVSVLPTDCGDPLIVKNGQNSGVFEISPQKNLKVNVFCDFGEEGRPLTVIQNRVDNSVDFDRDWADYKAGFGDLTGNFWLGNDQIHKLVSAAPYTLRIDMKYFDGESFYAEYSTFYIAGEEDGYRLQVGGYSGDAGDALQNENGLRFTTKDVDNDANTVTNCALKWNGGWWFNNCFMSFLNGIHYNKHMLTDSEKFSGIHWLEKRDGFYSLQTVSMKLIEK